MKFKFNYEVEKWNLIQSNMYKQITKKNLMMLEKIRFLLNISFAYDICMCVCMYNVHIKETDQVHHVDEKI